MIKACCRFKDAEKRIAAAEDQEHRLQTDIADLQEKLRLEKETSASEIAAALERFQGEADAKVSAAVLEAESNGAKAVQTVQSQLAARESELQV